MRLLKQAFAVLGALVVLTVVVAFVAPKRTQGLVAALVQIVPGTTTHIGQNESRLVSLSCSAGNNFCNAVDSSGTIASSPYQVPIGSTLVVTDYDFFTTVPSADAGITLCDLFVDNSTFKAFQFNGSCGVADIQGRIFVKERYTTGVRVGSGITIMDQRAFDGTGSASLQGYLVPND